VDFVRNPIDNIRGAWNWVWGNNDNGFRDPNFDNPGSDTNIDPETGLIPSPDRYSDSEGYGYGEYENPPNENSSGDSQNQDQNYDNRTDGTDDYVPQNQGEGTPDDYTDDINRSGEEAGGSQDFPNENIDPNTGLIPTDDTNDGGGFLDGLFDAVGDWLDSGTEDDKDLNDFETQDLAS
jgi:hypothetical protein